MQIGMGIEAHLGYLCYLYCQHILVCNWPQYIYMYNNNDIQIYSNAFIVFYKHFNICCRHIPPTPACVMLNPSYLFGNTELYWKHLMWGDSYIRIWCARLNMIFFIFRPVREKHMWPRKYRGVLFQWAITLSITTSTGISGISDKSSLYSPWGMYTARKMGYVNSLVPGRYRLKFWSITLKEILLIGGWGTSCEIGLRSTKQDLSHNNQTLFEVMPWCSSGKNPLLEAMFTHMNVTEWRHLATGSSLYLFTEKHQHYEYNPNMIVPYAMVDFCIDTHHADIFKGCAVSQCTGVGSE